MKQGRARAKARDYILGSNLILGSIRVPNFGFNPAPNVVAGFSPRSTDRYLRFKALLGSTATLRMSVFAVTSNPIE